MIKKIFYVRTIYVYETNRKKIASGNAHNKFIIAYQAVVVITLVLVFIFIFMHSAALATNKSSQPFFPCMPGFCPFGPIMLLFCNIFLSFLLFFLQVILPEEEKDGKEGK